LSVTALVLIFVAALGHATWNLFSKQASAAGATLFIWLVSAAATVLFIPVVAVAVLAGHPHLTAANWAVMAGTGVLQVGYFSFLQRGYQAGDLSLVYPIGRGTGALLAALAGIVLLGERPGPVSIAGIGAIIAGIVIIGLPPRRAAAPVPEPPDRAPLATAPPAMAPPDSAAPAPAAQAPAARPGWRAAVGLALGTGAFIASYTLCDKYAVSTLKTPPILEGYAAFPVMLVAFAPQVFRHREDLGGVWRKFWPQVLGAGLLTPGTYMLVLVALSFTAVSAVAPAREVSVLFGVILGRRMLGEGGLPRKLAAAAAIVAGIVAVAVG
jgi:drug/metabolite transporter (DMT)-like permease